MILILKRYLSVLKATHSPAGTEILGFSYSQYPPLIPDTLTTLFI